jgi:membrane protein implicated in regulation of membrane protease activity
MTTFTRYTLFQVPGWIVAAAILFGLQQWLDFRMWIAVALFAVYVVKDFLLYPFLRSAYEGGPSAGAAALIGLAAVAEQDLAPRGYVRVRGELWEAEAARGTPPIPRGATVRVRSARGMRLVVSPE